MASARSEPRIYGPLSAALPSVLSLLDIYAPYVYLKSLAGLLYTVNTEQSNSRLFLVCFSGHGCDWYLDAEFQLRELKKNLVTSSPHHFNTRLVQYSGDLNFVLIYLDR